MGGRDYLGEFEQVVLLALVRLGEGAYGASIHEEILATTGRDVSIPAVYVTLKRLEAKGLVDSRIEGGGDRGGRATRNYVLLPAGVRSLERSREMLENLWRGSRVGRPGWAK
jgi:DNA-binding PadR family transcriptional regulator